MTLTRRLDRPVQNLSTRMHPGALQVGVGMPGYSREMIRDDKRDTFKQPDGLLSDEH